MATPKIIGDVIIRQRIEGKMMELEVMVQGGDSDVAIDTMLLAILQICSAAGVEPADVITRTAFRMGELAKTLVAPVGDIDA